MVPFIYPDMDIPFSKGDWIFVPHLASSIANGKTEFTAYVVHPEEASGSPDACAAAESVSALKDPDSASDLQKITLKMDPLTDDEKDIILKGCLINYYRD